MTNADVFSQILSEVTGRPKSEVTELLDLVMKAVGSRARLDDEIPDDQAQELLEKLRQEKPGILAWLVRGGMLANPGNIQGAA